MHDSLNWMKCLSTQIISLKNLQNDLVYVKRLYNISSSMKNSVWRMSTSARCFCSDRRPPCDHLVNLWPFPDRLIPNARCIVNHASQSGNKKTNKQTNKQVFFFPVYYFKSLISSTWLKTNICWIINAIEWHKLFIIASNLYSPKATPRIVHHLFHILPLIVIVTCIFCHD